MTQKTPRPWYALPGSRDAYRSIKEQLKGLAPLFDQVAGRTVLDVGCAEGVMCHHAMERAAASAMGVEREPTYVQRARELCGSWGDQVRFVCHDLNHGLLSAYPAKPEIVDVVLMLAIVHKLRFPGNLLDEMSTICRDLAVIRLPRKSNGVINDGRSGFKLFDVPKHMAGRGFELEHAVDGPHQEPTLYFRRKR